MSDVKDGQRVKFVKHGDGGFLDNGEECLDDDGYTDQEGRGYGTSQQSDDEEECPVDDGKGSKCYEEPELPPI